MPNGNTVYLAGHLGRDPELKYTSNNLAICRLALAVKDGFQKDATTSWVEVTLFGALAERIGREATKGSGIYVCGRLKEDKWQDKDGQKRSRVGVIGQTCDVDDRQPRQGGQHSSPSPGPANSAQPQSAFDPAKDDGIPF